METIKLEITLYFEPEMEGSINDLKQTITTMLFKSDDIEGLSDIDIQTIKSEKVL